MNPKFPEVAILYRLDHPGGTQSVCFALIRGLNRLGIRPDVLWDLPPDPVLLEKNKCQAGYYPLHFPISTPTIDRLPASLRYLAWIFDTYDGSSLASRYDFFYLFHNPFLLPESVPHLRYLNGPPLLPQLWKPPSGLRGWPVHFFGWFYHAFLRRRFPAYEYHQDSPTVINSQYTADLFAQAHGVRLPVVYPPIQFTGRDYSLDDIHRRDSLTFFSRIVDYKRPDILLDLAACYPTYRAVIMGGVPDHRRPFFESLKRQAAERKLNNVLFLANPSQERVMAELRRTRFYIFPAENEHFGMTTVEAAASGAIPFVHDSGGQRYIVPFPELRFDYSNFDQKFANLAAKSAGELNDLRTNLAAHIQQYSEESTVGKLLAYLPARAEQVRQAQAVPG